MLLIVTHLLEWVTVANVDNTVFVKCCYSCYSFILTFNKLNNDVDKYIKI